MTQFLLQTRDEIPQATETYFKRAKNWHKHPIKVSRTDYAKEYTSSAMEMILQRDGACHETSTPYSSYMIRKVER
jgi:hypothetical protein